jgi:hypothetical protein
MIGNLLLKKSGLHFLQEEVFYEKTSLFYCEKLIHKRVYSEWFLDLIITSSVDESLS